MNDLQVWWIFPKRDLQSITSIRSLSIWNSHRTETFGELNDKKKSLKWRTAKNDSKDLKKNVSEIGRWLAMPIVSLPYRNSKGEVKQRREHRRESKMWKRHKRRNSFYHFKQTQKTLEGKTKTSVFTSRFVSRNILIGKIWSFKQTKIRNHTMYQENDVLLKFVKKSKCNWKSSNQEF